MTSKGDYLLKTDVGGPSDHATKVALGLNILSNAIIFGALLDEGILAASLELAAVMY